MRIWIGAAVWKDSKLPEAGNHVTSFIAEIAHGCKITVEQSGAAFWTMIVTEPNRAQVRFSNVYVNVEQCLWDAETFGRFVLKKWGIPVQRKFQWQMLSPDSISPEVASCSTARG